jgi:hypothetical protein
MTKSELLFKCSKMPLVLMRMKFSEIKDVLRVKNYKKQMKTVILITCHDERYYAFHKFRTSKRIVQNIIKRSIKNSSSVFDDWNEAQETNINGVEYKFSKLQKKINNVKVIFTGQKDLNSSSSSDLSEEKMSDSEMKTVSSSNSFEPMYTKQSGRVKREQTESNNTHTSRRMSAIKQRLSSRKKVNDEELNTSLSANEEESHLNVTDKAKTSHFLKANGKSKSNSSSVKTTNVRKSEILLEPHPSAINRGLLVSNSISESYETAEEEDEGENKLESKCLNDTEENKEKLIHNGTFKNPMYNLKTQQCSTGGNYSATELTALSADTEFLLSIGLVLFVCFIGMSFYNLFFLKCIEMTMYEVSGLDALISDIITEESLKLLH